MKFFGRGPFGKVNNVNSFEEFANAYQMLEDELLKSCGLPSYVFNPNSEKEPKEYEKWQGD